MGVNAIRVGEGYVFVIIGVATVVSWGAMLALFLFHRYRHLRAEQAVAADAERATATTAVTGDAAPSEAAAVPKDDSSVVSAVV